MHQCPACGSRVETTELPLVNGRLFVVFGCTFCHYTRSEEFRNRFDFFTRYQKATDPVVRARHAICDDPCTKEVCIGCVTHVGFNIDSLGEEQ